MPSFSPTASLLSGGSSSRSQKVRSLHAEPLGSHREGRSSRVPCAAGGTLVFDLIHDKGSAQDFSDCYMAFSWKSPIPS